MPNLKCDVRRLDFFPERCDGSDVADWLDEGHNIDELDALVDAAPRIGCVERLGAPSEIEWPPLHARPVLDLVALHGLAGEIVEYLDPLVEATKIGMLLELLCAFGNAAGPNSYAVVVDDKHPARLFVSLVGPTSTGAKGSATAATRPFIRAMDEDWYNSGRLSGFGSGEGIVAYLSGDHAKPGESIEKRLFIHEPEFTRLLALNSRDGATMSSRLRQLFDDDRVHDALRGKNTLVEGAHVCIMAHVVPDELRQKLPKGDIHGGFANRFLFAFTQTAKRIASPKALDKAVVDGFVKRLSAALQFARQRRVMSRTAQADVVWERFYGSHRSDGLVGEIVAREDAQRLRLSVAYALLDCSEVIRPEHVLAAEAVVRYCVDSAEYIFDDHPEAKQLERLLEAARAVWPNGLTGAQCHAVFGNNLSADRMQSLKNNLDERGLARVEEAATGGRNAALLYANERIKRTKPTDDDSLYSLYSLYSSVCQQNAVADEGEQTLVAPESTNKTNEGADGWDGVVQANLYQGQCV